tara:strand:- start:152 stop:739 length:588 start_codon:yes stop_codon:yes gene_type:complete
MSSYANPNVPIPPNPVFVDALIGKLQTLFGSLSWLTHSFGRSYIKKTNRDGQEFSEPWVYQSNGNYYSVEFNDNLQAMSFFEVGTQTLNGEFERNITNYYDVELGVIFWVNLKKINSTKGANYYFTEELKKDVRNKLTNSIPTGVVLSINSIEENIDDIFANYSFNQLDQKDFFSYPYASFKFNLTATINESCSL